MAVCELSAPKHPERGDEQQRGEMGGLKEASRPIQ